MSSAGVRAHLASILQRKSVFDNVGPPSPTSLSLPDAYRPFSPRGQLPCMMKADEGGFGGQVYNPQAQQVARTEACLLLMTRTKGLTRRLGRRAA